MGNTSSTPRSTESNAPSSAPHDKPSTSSSAMEILSACSPLPNSNNCGGSPLKSGATKHLAMAGAKIAAEDLAKLGIGLSSAQIAMVLQVWRKARSQGADEPGHSIMTSAFMKSPEIEKVFSKSERLREDVQNASNSSNRQRLFVAEPRNTHGEYVRLHADRFTQTLDKVMSQLATIKQTAPMLQNLGRCHSHLKELGFDSKFWNVFAEAMIQKTLLWGTRNQRNQSVYQAWSLIVTFIIQNMRLGYNDGVTEFRRINKSQSLSQSMSAVEGALVLASNSSLTISSAPRLEVDKWREARKRGFMLKSHSMDVPTTKKSPNANVPRNSSGAASARIPNASIKMAILRPSLLMESFDEDPKDRPAAANPPAIAPGPLVNAGR